jgi:hypothetical protein
MCGPHVPNNELSSGSLPGPGFDQWQSFDDFALSFDGYDYYQDKPGDCTTIGEKHLRRYMETGRLPHSLTLLRTCLFWEQRKLHWDMYGPTPETKQYICALLEAIREKVLIREALKEPLVWSEWIAIDGVAKYEDPALDAGGVFELRAVDPDCQPVSIARFLGADTGGVLYIGSSRSSIRSRLKRLPFARRKGVRVEPVGYRLFLLDQIPAFQTSLANTSLEIRFAEVEFPKDQESRLVRLYVEQYGELPPLNSLPGAGVWVDQTADD